MKKKNRNNMYIFFIVFLISVSVLTILINIYNKHYDNTTKKEIKNAIILKDDKIDKSNNNKLVFIVGYLDFNKKELQDSLFDIKIKTPKMLRYVETYQWMENIETNKKGKQTYNYKKVWSSDIINSKKFHNKNYKNPVKKYASNKLYEQEKIKIGDFDISKDLYTEIQYVIKYKPDKNMKLPENFKIYKEYITNSKNPKHPNIGDVRIIYFYSDWTLVSILARQNGNTLKKHITKNNEKLISIIPGQKNIDDIVKNYNHYIIR